MEQVDGELQGSIQAAAQAELSRRALQERCRYYTPNAKAEEFINICKSFPPESRGIKILILRAGNSFGKSALATMLAEYLSLGLPNQWFDCVSYLRNFKRPNRGRIFTTTNAASNTYKDEMAKWFPAGRYTLHKDGRTFDKRCTWRNHSEFDYFTFEQDPQAGESITLHWAIIDEIMPHKFWDGLKARFRFGGLIIFVLSPVAGAAWMDDELEIPERLGNDVFVVQAKTEDACKQHGIRGHLEHENIVSVMKDFDEEVMIARAEGGYLHHAGRIYKTFRDYEDMGHVPEDIPDYHQHAWQHNDFTLYNIMDPHDRKPFAIGWYAVFRNRDVFTIAEWPDESWPMFHKMKDCAYVPMDYGKVIKETEGAIGKRADIRLQDPNFGNTPCFATKSTVKEDMLAVGKKLKYPLVFQNPPDALDGGHVRVKRLLGDPGKNIRPKFYILKHCRNHRYAFVHYGWKENKDETKGLSEKPELQFKDFADPPRYGALYGFRYIRKPEPVKIWKPRDYGKRTYRGA